VVEEQMEALNWRMKEGEVAAEAERGVMGCETW
jgi:hypothetical protein